MTVAPIVHLNGTSRESLLCDLWTAMNAIHEAGSALAKTAPNARDYYVGEPGLFDAACRQHDARMNALRQLYYDLQEQVYQIEDQHDSRRS